MNSGSTFRDPEAKELEGMDGTLLEGARKRWNMGRAWCGLGVGAGEGGV